MTQAVSLLVPQRPLLNPPLLVWPTLVASPLVPQRWPLLALQIRAWSLQAPQLLLTWQGPVWQTQGVIRLRPLAWQRLGGSL